MSGERWTCHSDIGDAGAGTNVCPCMPSAGGGKDLEDLKESRRA
jgi:hypothetical protein